MSPEWLRNIVDIDTLLKLNIVQITRICSTIIWNPMFEQTNDTTSIISIVVLEEKRVELRVKDGSKRVSLEGARILYYQILNLWCVENKCKYSIDDISLIYDTISKVEQCKSLSNIRNLAISLATNIYKYNTCNGLCTTVSPGKSVSKCNFRLSDIDKLSRFTAEGIVDVLNTISFMFIGKEDSNTFLRLEDIIVDCSGGFNTYTTTYYEIPSVSTLRDITRLYKSYITRWCEVNYTKTTDSIKLQSSIDSVFKADSIDKIYTITCSLLDNL